MKRSREYIAFEQEMALCRHKVPDYTDLELLKKFLFPETAQVMEFPWKGSVIYKIKCVLRLVKLRWKRLFKNI